MKKLTNTKYVLLLLVPLMIMGSCKTQKKENSQGNTEHFLIHLEDKYTVSDVSLLNGYSVESAKRTSRSQNLWLVKIMMKNAEKERLINALENAVEVVSVSESTPEGTITYTNKDKKKSKPNN